VPSKKIVDLTLTIHEGMTTFPVHWHPFVEITKLGRLNFERRETRKIVIGSHTGTHMDAPRHFIAGGKTIDEIDPELFIGPCTLLDMTDFGSFAEVPAGVMRMRLGDARPRRVMLRFDWSDKIFEPNYYSDHPFLSEECARLLVESGVKLLAMDTPMPDSPKNCRGSPNDSPNHHILLGAEVVLVEYVTNLRALGAAKDIELFVLPLKIESGDGSPVRCLARVIDGA
jgi:arylformamidase